MLEGIISSHQDDHLLVTFGLSWRGLHERSPDQLSSSSTAIFSRTPRAIRSFAACRPVFTVSNGCWAILKLADLEETALPHRSLIKRFCFCYPFFSVTRFERFPPRSLLTICFNCGNEYYFIHLLVPFFRKVLTTTTRAMLKSVIHVFVECKLKLWSIEYNQSVVIFKQQPRDIKGIVVLFRRTAHQQRQFSGWTVNWRLSTFSWEGRA